MTTNTTSKSILALGLGAGIVAGVYHDASRVQADLKAETARAQSLGYDLVFHGIDSKDRDTIDAAGRLMESKPWGVVSIGFGVRGDASLTDTFEELVGLAITKVTPTPKLVFPLAPTEALDRGMKVLGQG